MASLRVFQPLVRQSPRLTLNTTNRYMARRLLTTDNRPTLYTAHATVSGARAGHAKGEHIDFDLAMPKDLGGSGNATNPEELFAAGYGACFQSAMAAAASSLGIKLPEGKENSVIESTVTLVGDPKKLDMGIKVDMKVKLKGISQTDADKVIAKAKDVCPYSRATKGNVATNIEAEVS